MVERELQHAQAYAARALPYSGRIDDFQPLLQIGRQGAGQRGRGLGAAHPVRAGHAARRWRCGNGARTATRAAAFERARRAWVDIGQAGRAFRAAHPRAAAARWRGPAAGAAARGPGRGRRGSGRRRAAGWLVGQPGRTGADYSTAVGEQRTVDWDGGQAVVELDARTRMNVADGPRRLELLEGQAAITCAEQGQGLTVAASAGEILLDAASVGLRRSGDEVTVTCLRGRVDIRHPSRELALEAGQQARYGAVAVTAPARADLEQAMGWREGVLVFRDMPLAEAVAEINRYRPGRIMVLDDALAARRVSGRFQIARLDLAIDRIREAFGAHVRQLPKGIVLLS